MSRREPHGPPPDPGPAEISPDRWWTTRRTITALLIGTVLNTVGLGVSLLYDIGQQAYIEGRGEARDRENERLQQRFDDRICQLLESLPATPLLDIVRRDQGCGPGRPVDDFPPEVQRDLDGAGQPSVAEPTAPAVQPADPPLGSSAVPGRPGGAPEPQPPPDPSPGPPPEPDPLQPSPVPADPLAPITETVCDLTDLCLEVPLP